MELGLQKANHYNQLSEWVQRVDACRKSGQKVSEWCAEQGIPVSTYYLSFRKKQQEEKGKRRKKYEKRLMKTTNF